MARRNGGARRPDGKRSIRELGEEIVGLRRAIDNLERRLAREVRTRRVTVEAPDGFPRIVATAGERGGQVRVRTRSRDEVITGAELFANDLEPGAGHVGLALTRGGDVVAVFEATDDADPRVWSDNERGR
ncbi:MAG: hypothetical protein WD271_01205 [Acidimicrobiia bacterium]